MQEQIKKTQEIIKGLRVIVVDDVSDSRDVLEMYLMQQQAFVKAVSCAKDALQAIKYFQPELIISDIYMPEEDGYWLIKQLKIHHKENIPAIAVTAAAKEEERKRLIAAGYDGYLSKPFFFQDLTILITEIMAKSKKFFDR